MRIETTALGADLVSVPTREWTWCR